MTVLPGRTVFQGNPRSSLHQVDQAEAGAWAEYVEGLAGANIVAMEDALADLPAASGIANGSFAIVFTTSPGVYQEQSDAWVKVAELPPGFSSSDPVVLTAGGTADAITATANRSWRSDPFFETFTMEVPANNGGPVTVAIDGGTARPLITSAGNALAEDYLSAGMVIDFRLDGTSYRLTSTVSDAAVLAGAVSAQAAAEAAAAVFDYSDVAITGGAITGLTEFQIVNGAEPLPFSGGVSLYAQDHGGLTPASELLVMNEDGDINVLTRNKFHAEEDDPDWDPEEYQLHEEAAHSWKALFNSGGYQERDTDGNLSGAFIGPLPAGQVRLARSGIFTTGTQITHSGEGDGYATWLQATGIPHASIADATHWSGHNATGLMGGQVISLGPKTTQYGLGDMRLNDGGYDDVPMWGQSWYLLIEGGESGDYGIPRVGMFLASPHNAADVGWTLIDNWVTGMDFSGADLTSGFAVTMKQGQKLGFDATFPLLATGKWSAPDGGDWNIGYDGTALNITANGQDLLRAQDGHVSIEPGANEIAGLRILGSSATAKLAMGQQNNTSYIAARSDGTDTTTLAYITALAGVEAVRMTISGGGDVAMGTDGFFYDASEKRLGIGTDTPVQALDLVGNAVATGFMRAGGGFVFQSANDAPANILRLQDSGFNNVGQIAVNGMDGSGADANWFFQNMGNINFANTGDIQRNGAKVLGDRQTGWGAPTGTATRTTFDTATVTLEQLAERVHAVIDDLTTHGLIGA